MKRLCLSVVAALAVALGASGPASAATANPNASCAGLAGASRAGQPGAEAEAVAGVRAAAEADGVPPGAIFGDFARHHDQTAEVCLG